VCDCVMNFQIAIDNSSAPYLGVDRERERERELFEIASEETGGYLNARLLIFD
jgi:hypothetical protein